MRYRLTFLDQTHMRLGDWRFGVIVLRSQTFSLAAKLKVEAHAPVKMMLNKKLRRTKPWKQLLSVYFEKG